MRRLTRRREGGAALVEMALILPLFVLLLFGMIEAGWAFAQANDIRHGAREGARLAATDFAAFDGIVDEVCDRMDIAPSGKTTVYLTSGDENDDGDGGRNATGSIRIVTVSPGLTGLISSFVDVSISSDIDFRLEQPGVGDAAWWIPGGGEENRTCI